MIRSISAGTLFLAMAAFAQAPPAFEVATIKPNRSETWNSSTYTSRGELRIENASLKSCIQRAYDVREFTFSGPDWLDTERFDILAKPPAGTSPKQFMPMLQTLLVERFKLKFHYEPRELSAYALIVAKKGPKLEPTKQPGDNTGTTTGRGLLRGTRMSMAVFADQLGRQLDRPVENLTELTGVYDLELKWTPDDQVATSDAPPGPSIFAALQEQLGLQLQARKLPVQVLVVDSVERVPTEN